MKFWGSFTKKKWRQWQKKNISCVFPNKRQGFLSNMKTSNVFPYALSVEPPPVVAPRHVPPAGLPVRADRQRDQRGLLRRAIGRLPAQGGAEGPGVERHRDLRQPQEVLLQGLWQARRCRYKVIIFFNRWFLFPICCQQFCCCGWC